MELEDVKNALEVSLCTLINDYQKYVDRSVFAEVGAVWRDFLTGKTMAYINVCRWVKRRDGLYKEIIRIRVYEMPDYKKKTDEQIKRSIRWYAAKKTLSDMFQEVEESKKRKKEVK